jgi:hypothetical protein
LDLDLETTKFFGVSTDQHHQPQRVKGRKKGKRIKAQNKNNWFGDNAYDYSRTPGQTKIIIHHHHHLI